MLRRGSPATRPSYLRGDSGTGRGLPAEAAPSGRRDWAGTSGHDIDIQPDRPPFACRKPLERPLRDGRPHVFRVFPYPTLLPPAKATANGRTEGAEGERGCARGRKRCDRRTRLLKNVVLRRPANADPMERRGSAPERPPPPVATRRGVLRPATVRCNPVCRSGAPRHRPGSDRRP